VAKTSHIYLITLAALTSSRGLPSGQCDYGDYPELEFVLFEGLERRGASAQRIVFGDAVEDMNAAVVQQRRLGNGPFNRSRAPLATFERLVSDFLNRFEPVPFFALIFVEWHDS
jgi:hypothetical protein